MQDVPHTFSNTHDFRHLSLHDFCHCNKAVGNIFAFCTSAFALIKLYFFV